MDAKAAMHSGAINTEEDPIGNRSPSRILSIAIKTRLVFGLGFELPEDDVLVGEGVGGHWRGIGREKNPQRGVLEGTPPSGN